MKIILNHEMKVVLNGFNVDIKTKIDGHNRLSAQAIVPDLDSMVVARVSGPTITGRISQADEDSIVLKVINKAIAEFRTMAAMAIGRGDAK